MLENKDVHLYCSLGNSSTRNVESYGTFSRKRKRSESDNDEAKSIDDKNGNVEEKEEGMDEEESEFDILLAKVSGGEGKRRKIVYDVSNHCSEDEELLDSVDALDNHKKIDDSKKVKGIF